MDLAEVARSLAEYFERNGKGYAVIGGFALYAYGYVRATQDLDFAVRRNDKTAVTHLLESLGFETVHSTDAFSNHVHPAGGARVDMMYLDGSTADKVLGDATRRAVVGGLALAVASPEHLIAMKIFAAESDPTRRLKDLADVAEVVRRTSFDKGKLRGMLERHGLEEYYDGIIGSPDS